MIYFYLTQGTALNWIDLIFNRAPFPLSYFTLNLFKISFYSQDCITIPFYCQISKRTNSFVINKLCTVAEYVEQSFVLIRVARNDMSIQYIALSCIRCAAE